MSAPDLSSISSNLLPAVQKGFSTTLNGSITNATTTITLNSVSGYSNGDAVFLWIDPGTSTAELVYGTVATSTTQLTGCVRAVLGSASAHSSGATVAQYVSSADHMAVRKHLKVQHNDDGTHKAVTATSVATTSSVTAGNGLTMSAGTFSPTGTWDNWVATGESWTYASSTTITVPSDATTKYNYGDYVKLTQSSTVKYFVVTGVTSTVLTVSGLYGATLANSAISAPAYSKARNPQGIAGILPLNPYKFYGYLNSAYTISGSTTPIPFDAELFDTGSNFDTVTNKGRFTAPVAGFYWFHAAFTMNATFSAATGVSAALHKNGSFILQGQSRVETYTGSGTYCYIVSGLLQLAANDYVTVVDSYNSGKALATGSTETFFTGYLVSAT